MALDTVASPTSDEASVVTAAPPTTSQPGSTVSPLTSAEVKFDDVTPPTTAIGSDMATTPPVPMVVTPVISDASVRALAAVLGVGGEPTG